MTLCLVHGECDKRHFLGYLHKYPRYLRKCQLSTLVAFVFVCSHDVAIFKTRCLIFIAFATAVVVKMLAIKLFSLICLAYNNLHNSSMHANPNIISFSK